MAKKKQKTAFNEWCEKNYACPEGLSATLGQTFEEFWSKSNNGDWMMWVVKKIIQRSTPYDHIECALMWVFQCWCSELAGGRYKRSLASRLRRILRAEYIADMGGFPLNR